SLVLDRIATQKNNTHVPHWQSRLSEEDKELAVLLVDHILQCITPLVTYKTNKNSTCGNLSISDWTKLTVTCLQNVCLDEHRKLPNLWFEEEGKTLSSLFSKIIETGSCIKANAIEWIDIITRLIDGETVKP
ncbi:double-strand break repair protein AddB, partial [Candidatus Liberibacter asiaticus]